MRRKATAGALALLLAAPAGAAADDDWRFQVTPYLWGAGSKAEIRPRAGGPTFESDMSFGDIFDRLDGAFFLTASARYKRFVVSGDLTWVSLSDDGSITGVLPVPVSVKGDLTQTSQTLTAGYSVAAQPKGALDIVGGLRAWQIDASASAEARIAPSYALGASTSRGLSWVDPIVGVRGRYEFAPDWSVIGYADVGGYDGRTTWQAFATLNYRISDAFYVSAGYRHMALDYDDGDTRLDLELGGPIIGATLRF
ncbi:hypothetical protein [Amorphus coralli]|uniref:hypothetical protein n=1 Tax=Amorphus coralli TaxID=340680 RepID=UPI0003776CCF|nr:hypothetical protein [Amorphus coralli]